MRNLNFVISGLYKVGHSELVSESDNECRKYCKVFKILICYIGQMLNQVQHDKRGITNGFARV